MRRYFGAAGIVAAIGALTSAMAFADTGMASANDDELSSQTEILVNPDLVTQPETGTDLDEAGALESLSHDLVIITEPMMEGSVPENSTEIKAASLRELVDAQPTQASLSSEMECLAGTVYFESKGESLSGQLAVAEVVLARRDSRRWPNSICGVVYQKSQFSFVRGGRMPAINRSSNAWRNAVAIAQIATSESWESPVKGSYFFHARYVSPGWRLQRVGSVDNHIFYR